MTGSYHVAVFSAHPFLPLEFLRIGFVSLLYLVSVFGWGNLTCRLLQIPQLSISDFFSTRLVMGCFALYVTFVLLSVGGFLHPTAVLVTLAAGLILGIAQTRSVSLKVRDALRRISAWTAPHKALVASVCFLLVLQIACGFTPLTFYDSQVYHLLAPVQFLSAGSLIYIRWNVLTNGPMALQLTFGMSWIADPTGNTFKLLMTVFGCLVVLAAARIASELGLRAALFAALFVLAYPEFWIQQTLGAVDLAVASFLLFGTIWWIQALKVESRAWTALSAIAFGFVVGSRYQGIVLVAWVITAVFAADCLTKRRVDKQALLNCLSVAAVILVMSLPWLVRNYSNFGNPVFPLMQQSLGGSEWSPDQAARFQADVMGTPISQLTFTHFLMGPVGALLMKPSNGLFGLGLLMGSLMVLSESFARIRVYAALGIGGLILWGLIHPTPSVQLLRFNAASLVLMLACTGALLGSDRFHALKGSYIAVTLTLGSIVIAFVSLNGIVPVWKTLTNAAARTEYWRANVPSSHVFEFANDKLDPARHKILLIGETRALWLRTPFIAASAYNGPELLRLFRPDTGPDDWVAQLRLHHVTHILICSAEWQRLADGYGYFRLGDDHLNRFNAWVHALPLSFDDHQGNVLLELP